MGFSHNIPRNITGCFNSINMRVQERIDQGLDKIYSQHDIDPRSPLGILLKNGLQKLLVGLHHLHDAIEKLNSELDEDNKFHSKASIKRLFYNDFLNACALPTIGPRSQEAKERILCLEVGRTKVTSTLLRNIREHSGRDLHGSFKILGSLVRQSLDIYRELGGAEFNVCKNPPTHLKNVANMLQQQRQTGITHYDAA